MLPDFRFVLGGILAITLLAVAGLGLVTSVRLAQEARMGPLQDSRSLAYAGHAEWNQFYDPDAARRFEDLAKKTEGPLAETRIETPAETSAIAPSSPEERTASIPAHRPEPDVAPIIAPVTVKAPDTDPPQTDPPPLAETPTAPPAEAAGGLTPDVPGPAGSGAAPERIASAPAAWPGADLRDGTQMPTPTPAPAPAPAQPQASGDPHPDSTPPAPRVRPKPHFRKKIVRAHIHRFVAAKPQAVQNSGFSTSNAPWPGYDSFPGAITKKNTGNLTGTLTNRPQ
jgi:hypothetical protein